MLDPAISIGTDIQLYPVQADLTPDLGKLDDLLSAYGKPVKALLATHFFGFVQNFSALKEWCEKHQIMLIEDCSHVLFTESFQAAGAGLYGKFVAASPYKFFACKDGGLLYSRFDHLLESVAVNPASLMNELRGVQQMLEHWQSIDTTAPEIALIDKRLQEFNTNPPVTAEEQITPYSEPSSLYIETEARTSALRLSRFVVGRTPIEEIIRRRHNNYQRWTKAVSALPNCHTPFPDLSENCVPYMFPLHIEYPAPHFYRLKHLGLPVWRWDEMAVSDCPIAQDYRLHLLHLPCHQSLTESQMDWMIAAVQKTMRQPLQGAK